MANESDDHQAQERQQVTVSMALERGTPLCACVFASEWVAELCIVWGGGLGIIDRLFVLEKRPDWDAPTLHGRFPLINPNEDTVHTDTQTQDFKQSPQWGRLRRRSAGLRTWRLLLLF